MGTGYTRQSAADIVDDAIIEAVDHNAEFNAIEAAFSGSTGHSHDGTLGEGPQLNLTTAVLGVLPITNGGTGANTAQGALDSLFASGKHVDDDLFFIAASADNTKRLRFNVGAYTTATDRTITLPDTNITISSFIATLLDDADAATARTTLGLTLGTNVQAYDADLTALAALNSTGIAVRTASNTWAQRTIEGTSNQVTVTNGNGISGSPTISLPSAVTISGLMTAGSLSGTGAAITALNASNIATGTLGTSRLSGSYHGVTGTGVLSAGSITSGFGNINIGSSTFTGNGSGLTTLNASNISSGTIDTARLPSVLSTSNAFFDGDVYIRQSSSALHIGYDSGGVSPHIAFYGNGNTSRTGYIQSDPGTGLRIVNDIGGSLIIISDAGNLSFDGSSVITVSNASSLLGFVPEARTITASTGLTGGGSLAANRTLSVSSDVWRDGNGPSKAQLDSSAGGTIPLMYTGSTQDATVFPIGHIVAADNNAFNIARNESMTVRIGPANHDYSRAGSGTVLSGTWRHRGSFPTSHGIFQRVA